MSSVSVRFPSLGDEETFPEDVHIVQEEYRHDIAVYTIRTKRSVAPYRHGTPVVITWSSDRDYANFCGYVHHFEPSGSDNVTRIWCRGASSVLDNGVQSTFRYRNVPSLVSEVARSTNFDAEVMGHGRVFDTINATGGRMWDVLVQYAKEIGYSLYCTNTRLQCRPKLGLVEQFAAEAPVLRYGDTLAEFMPMDGVVAPGKQRTHRIISGVDPRTGYRFSVTGGVAPSKLGRVMSLPAGQLYESVEVNNPEEARWKLAAMAENDRFNITATAVADGNARVTQTWPVIIADIGDRYDGIWVARKVTHKLQGPRYSMELELGRDALGNTIPIPDGRARRVLATRSNPTGRPRAAYPPSVLVGGQWRAQWSSSTRSFFEPNLRVRR